MADGGFRFQPGAAYPFSPQSPYSTSSSDRHFNRRHPSPPRARLDFSKDLASSRSPVRQRSPSDTLPSMYGQNHQHGQNVYMNGSGHSHGRYGMHVGSKPFGGGSGHHGTHNHRNQQDHIGQVHGNFVSHQHNGSTPVFSPATSQFTPGQLRNGASNHVSNGVGRPLSEHHQKQIECAEQSRQAIGNHYHARNSNSNKAPTLAALHALKDKETAEGEERQRATSSQETAQNQWTELDMGGQGMRALAPQIFQHYPFLTALYLNNNRLTSLPSSIGLLRQLTHLDVSGNLLTDLPTEIGMLVNLKSLWLFDNHLETLPHEIGYLHNLDLLGIEGNPLEEEMKGFIMDEGTKAFVARLLEIIQVPEVDDRPLVTINEVAAKGIAQSQDSFSVLSYNTLCPRSATRALYGYTPESALAWENRRQVILSEIEAREAEIVCLQEVDVESWNEFYRPELARKDYKGVYWPKTRARTMTEKESRNVDGCATFFKHGRYVLLDKTFIDIAGTAIKRLDMRSEHDMFNRVMLRDNIATVSFLEERVSGTRLIVVNTHLHWDVAFADVKVVQTAILLEELARIADEYAKRPACTDKTLIRFDGDELEGGNGDVSASSERITPGPSQEYAKGSQIPMILCGDFNSVPSSGVYELLNNGALAPTHRDLSTYKYGNFTRDGMTHPFSLKSAYGQIGEMKFTNYTPGFVGVLDYIWYSTGTLGVMELLGDIDEAYLKRVPGFPNIHFPSDHLALLVKFAIRARKGGAEGRRKATEDGTSGRS